MFLGLVISKQFNKFSLDLTENFLADIVALTTKKKTLICYKTLYFFLTGIKTLLLLIKMRLWVNKMSCINILTYFFQYVSEVINIQHQVDTIYLDFQLNFDQIEYSGLV